MQNMQELRPNTIRARLLLTSTGMTADEITVLTGLSPEHALPRVDSTIKGRRRPHHSWYYSTASCEEDLESGPRMGDMADRLLNEIRGAIAACVQPIREGRLKASIVCEIWVKDYSPSIDFRPETLREIAAMGASITFDFYWWPQGDGQTETAK